MQKSFNCPDSSPYRIHDGTLHSFVVSILPVHLILIPCTCCPFHLLHLPHYQFSPLLQSVYSPCYYMSTSIIPHVSVLHFFRLHILSFVSHILHVTLTLLYFLHVISSPSPYIPTCYFILFLLNASDNHHHDHHHSTLLSLPPLFPTLVQHPTTFQHTPTHYLIIHSQSSSTTSPTLTPGYQHFTVPSPLSQYH